jgi:putative aminopeptidase FrvX
MHDRDLLFDLSAAAGPVGYEDGVRGVVREALAELEENGLLAQDGDQWRLTD